MAGTAGWLPVQAAAQEAEGPVIVGARRELEGFRLQDVNVALDLVGQYRTGSVKPANGAALKEREQILREALTLSSSSYIGHPNLIDLEMAGTFGLSQEWLDSDLAALAAGSSSERTIETIFEYDVKALILRESSRPVTLYSNRSQTLINRQFGESIDSVVTTVGARALLRSETLPTSLHYFHRIEDQTSRSGNVGFNTVQDTFEWFTQYQPEPEQLYTWDYTFDNIEQSGFLRPTQSIQRHNAHATHSVNFGPNNEHNLRSSLQAFHEAGDFPLDRVRLEELLRLRHRPDLETHYTYTFDWQKRPAADQFFNQGLAGFRHQLFDSLVTSGNVFANYRTASPDFSSYEFGGLLRFDYHKRVPLGRLSAGTFINLSQQTSSDQGAAIQVIDEPRTFGPTGLVVIDRRNIVPGSIRVTDASGLILFSPGADFIVTSFGNRVEIRRVLGGDIGDEQAVLIDFDIGPEPGRTLTTFGTGASIRYDIDEGLLRGLGAYARYSHQEQSVSDSLLSPAALFIDTTVDDYVYGADYRIWNVFFGAEQHVRESTISPFTITRLEARYTQPLGPRSTLTVHASQHDIERPIENLHTQITLAGARYSQPITERLFMNASVLWRHEEDNVGLELDGFEQQLDFNWRYRQTTVYGAVRNAMLESTNSDSTFQTFLLGLRREF